MKVFIDMDGVLADFDKQFESRLTKAGVYAKNMAHSWKLTERVLDSAAIKNKNAFVNHILSAPGFWSGIRPIDGCIEVVNRWLKNKKLELYIATSPWVSSPTCMIEKVDWIRAYLPKFPKSNIIMIAKKELLRGDVIIDDKPEHIRNWKGTHAICYAQPWNEDIRTDIKYTESWVWRVHSWKSIDTIMKNLLEDSTCDSGE